MNTDDGKFAFQIMTTDDEPSALRILNRAVHEAEPNAEVRSFSDASEAAAEIRDHGYRPDAAFLDIMMPGCSGLQMAKMIRERSPHTNIVFVTAYSDYTLDALKLHSSGYMIKPPTAENILAEFNNLLYPPKQERRSRIWVQCFGRFELFEEGIPVQFPSPKCKEILAYLIDRRGTVVNTGELCSVLWEADSISRKSQLRTYIAELSHTLEKVGAQDIFIKSRNSFAVAKERIDCDYYRFLEGETAAVNTYMGEYMSQYSWAEMTLGTLTHHNAI